MSKDDPYLYDDVEVLKNKLNIKNQNQLENFEADDVIARFVIAHKNPREINSIFEIKEIHKFLFGHIFEWAGEFRIINMYKREKILSGFSVDYTPCGYIEEELAELDKKFQKIDWDFLTNMEKVWFISDIVQELWQIHPFREGNTRTTALFTYLLMKQIGLHLNTEFLGKNAMFFRNSLVLASIGFRSKKEYLLGILTDAVSYLNVDENKYKTIEGVNCEKYTSSPHTIEKLKTIKDLRDLEK